ncbi:MAG: nucleoside hydrolase [Ktedonobacteraceae bacterium]
MQRIILDTDPGIDDALALFLALASPEVTLEAVTTVSGNVSVEQTTYNALTLLTLAGRTDIPVAYGSAEPLVRTRVDAAHVHGHNGLGDVVLPEPAIAPVEHQAVDFLIDTIMSNPGEITLVGLGPLTNLALAVRREPRIAQQVCDVVIMGGALRVPGNVTPSAEFNIFADPHAAHIVFHAGWPLRLVSLDVTTSVSMQRQQVEALTAHGGKVTTAIQQMMAYYFDVFGPTYGSTTFHMHDPLCLAAAFQPDLITWEPAYVDVELAGNLTLGETVAYFQRPDAPTPNMHVSVGVDSERFLNLFIERIGKTFGGGAF